MCKSQPTDDKLSLIGAWSGRDPLQNFWGSSHITGTAEPKVVKFCIRVGYINSSNRMTYHQQKGLGCGHVFYNFRDAARRVGWSATAKRKERKGSVFI